MALASIGERELKMIAAESRQLLVEIDNIEPAEYARRQLRIARVMDICYSADNLNPPIVIFNSVANTLIASFIPLALLKGTLPMLSVDLPIIGFIAIPGAGTEALTFIATIVFLVIFGEVIPKKLAREYPLWFIRRLAIIIRFVDFFFGWLGASFLSIVDIPTYIFRKLFRHT
jgi:CBS domain containing-hemolysin-like protein